MNTMLSSALRGIRAAMTFLALWRLAVKQDKEDFFSISWGNFKT
jgi:hypothetical protein